MRSIGAVALVVLFPLGSCGNAPAAAPSTTVPSETPPSTAFPSTTDPIGSDPECLAMWPEDLVRQIAGDPVFHARNGHSRQFTFWEASPDGASCIHTAAPASVALSFRQGGTQELRDARAANAELGEDAEVCDGAYVVASGDAATVEAVDRSAGRILSASAIGVADPFRVARDLLATAC